MSERAESTEPEPTRGEAPNAHLDAEGRERPAFLLGFPNDPSLAPLVSAFERGDFRFVRANAKSIAEAATSEPVRLAALELRRRIDPDPLVLKLLVCAGLLFVFLVGWSYLGQ